MTIHRLEKGCAKPSRVGRSQNVIEQSVAAGVVVYMATRVVVCKSVEKCGEGTRLRKWGSCEKLGSSLSIRVGLRANMKGWG